MGRMWTARVRADCRLPVVRTAGREFARGEAGVIREGEPGWAEMVRCPLLEVVEQETDEGRRTARKRRPSAVQGALEEGGTDD